MVSAAYISLFGNSRFFVSNMPRFLQLLYTFVLAACLTVAGLNGGYAEESGRLSAAIGIPQDPSNLYEAQYFDHAVLSLEGEGGKQFYLVYSYSQLSTGGQSSPALFSSVVSSVFEIKKDSFVPVRDRSFASTVLKNGSYVDSHSWTKLGKDGRLSSVVFPATGSVDCNMLSHRMYFTRKQYDTHDDWYFLRVSNRSQFADQELGRSCSNMEGQGRAWTKAATLTPAIYAIGGHYLIVDETFPLAVFFDELHPVCIAQKTADGQVILHLLSNRDLPESLKGDLTSENLVRSFQNKIRACPQLGDSQII
jgi:hypothetical protein